jgi:hypothetical protein
VSKSKEYEAQIYIGGTYVAYCMIQATSYEEAMHKGFDVRVEVLDRDRVADEEEDE